MLQNPLIRDITFEKIYFLLKMRKSGGDANGMVKTPTLRNITETAPYFHNGQIWSLNEAVKEMGSVQLGINISDEDSAKIVTFLKSLKGDKPQIIYPQLPESTMETEKPTFN